MSNTFYLVFLLLFVNCTIILAQSLDDVGVSELETSESSEGTSKPEDDPVHTRLMGLINNRQIPIDSIDNSEFVKNNKLKYIKVFLDKETIVVLSTGHVIVHAQIDPKRSSIKVYLIDPSIPFRLYDYVSKMDLEKDLGRSRMVIDGDNYWVSLEFKNKEYDYTDEVWSGGNSVVMLSLAVQGIRSMLKDYQRVKISKESLKKIGQYLAKGDLKSVREILEAYSGRKRE